MLIATHIINRLPTLIVQCKTPYEVLLGAKPEYEHLKVFGHLAFASNPAKMLISLILGMYLWLAMEWLWGEFCCTLTHTHLQN